jgi:hypothetical protein
VAAAIVPRMIFFMSSFSRLCVCLQEENPRAGSRDAR